MTSEDNDMTMITGMLSVCINIASEYWLSVMSKNMLKNMCLELHKSIKKIP